ncbi:hypothetical protein NKR19_g9770 [Coniochaeta hoffmannii]|uniref:Uncharacterized protein n=1 Tax=Coniochaeta hoffmannii TaxID=91930 RepID=A0AA38RFN3_9PEZI|nr:hypothetical protein NKR19_g9770 [Coniochaeta hoffmannii]
MAMKILSVSNGVYKASYDNLGNEVHILLTPEILQDDAAGLIAAHLVAAPPAAVTAPPVSQRDAYRRSYCDCGDNLDHSDTDAATDRLRDAIARGGGTAYVPIGEGIYGTVDGVTAFICTPKKNTAVTPVDRATYDYALGFVSEKCGRYVPGTYVHGDLNGEKMNQNAAQEDMGYKNNKYGDAWVCEHAEEGRKDHC